jgi:excisionase family DNA binding protein
MVRNGPWQRVFWKVVNVSSDQEVLLTPAEVASLFRVDPKTVTRWAKSGKLTSIRTLGGHRRYKESEVKALLSATTDNVTRNGGS